MLGLWALQEWARVQWVLFVCMCPYTASLTHIQFIAAATGGDVRDYDLGPCTIKIIEYRCPEQSDFDVVFVDIPGFDNTGRTNLEILKMIADWFNKMYAISSVQTTRSININILAMNGTLCSRVFSIFIAFRRK